LVAQEQGATPSAAETPSVAESIGREVQGIFERCRRAIVRIEAADLHGRLSGSGFFVDPSGTIYTSYSVGGESHDIVVCHGDMKYPARRVVADPRSGIAILKVDAETPFLVLGKSRELGLASPVLAIGYPMDLPLTPSFGTVGGFDIRYQQSYFATRHIRASVPVQRGEGGAPLLNMRGEAVGILIASLDGGSGSFALPIEAAEKVRKDFLRFGEVRPGWLGIEIEPAAAPVAGSTARVNDLMDNSPGQKAGLRKGDVLLRVGADLVQSPEDVRNAAFFLTADDELTVQISRDGEPLELKLHPADHPGSPRTARGGDAHIPSPEFAPLLPGGALPLGSER
jgi:serine protease Do